MVANLGRTRTRAWLPTALLLVLAVWGCEGTHLFAPITRGPEIIDLTATPDEVEAGESVVVSVRALGALRVDSIITTLRFGTFESTRIARQVGVSSDFSATVDFTMPAAVPDTVGAIEAFAIDARENIGPTASVPIRTTDTALPTVLLNVEDGVLGLGTQTEIRISAQDNVGLAQIGFRIVDLDGNVLTEYLENETEREVDRLISYTIPPDLPLGTVFFVGLAIDPSGNVGESSNRPVVLIDVDVAEVEILIPSPGAQHPGQDPLPVQIRLRDNDAIARVDIEGIAHRGDFTLGTNQEIQRFTPTVVFFDDQIVSDTILNRILTPEADRTGENAFVRVTAFDRAGNAARDSVEITLLADELPPVVQINTPPDGASRAIGGELLVETFIEKLPAPFRTGITTLRLEGVAFRGDPELGTDQVVTRYLTRTVTLDPPVFDGQVVSRYLPATGDTTEETVFIIATATDEWGNQGADTVSIHLAPDSIAPMVSISQPMAGASFAAGDSILVQAVGFEPVGEENQRGVVSIRADGVAYRPAPVLKYQESRVDFDPAVPQGLLTVYIQPTGDLTVEPVWIRVTAEDGGGNMTTDSVLVALTAPPPSPPPSGSSGNSGGSGDPGDQPPYGDGVVLGRRDSPRRERRDRGRYGARVRPTGSALSRL